MLPASDSNSKLTGTFYERCLSWKDNHDKWVEQEQKRKLSQLEKEIRDNHVETQKYSQRHLRNLSRNINNRVTCLTYDGVANHLERQYVAQKEKQLVKELKETGSHRNMLKKKQSNRVTVPKKKYNRKYIREAMDIISKGVPSSETNKNLTTTDLALKGLSHDDVIEAANDIENDNTKSIQYQFFDKNGMKINQKTHYKSAMQTLHNYLHSFDL